MISFTKDNLFLFTSFYKMNISYHKFPYRKHIYRNYLSKNHPEKNPFSGHFEINIIIQMYSFFVKLGLN